jgi:hypothetical protein
VQDGFSNVISVHDDAAAHALVLGLTVSDNLRHVAAIWVKHTYNAANCACSDVETDKIFLVLIHAKPIGSSIPL